MGEASYETGVSETLVSTGYSVSFRGYSALDRYMGFTPLPFTWVETDADISVLAKFFEGLRFPGRELADGAVDRGGEVFYFRCLDPEERFRPLDDPGASYRLLSLTQDWKTKRFRDPCGIYPLIRELRDGPPKNAPAREGRQKQDAVSPGPARLKDASPEAEPWWEGLYPGSGRYRAVMDGALILARYGAGNLSRPPVFKTLLQSFGNLAAGTLPNAENQRVLLTSILISPRPDLGLELLKAAGFVEALWPELALLDNVDHSKEYHPEGNVWNHTLETFRHRKPLVRNGTAYDFRLSLGLLLHDVGKPLAVSSGNRRFDGHAELGARAARKFLSRLEFDRKTIEDIFYLVKNHMLPAALPRLPLTRT
ncbi:MAG: HD domain-containing protein, partial [Treponema sp.]|nr:HD domain-containing protein [Treponema sp.]